MPHADWFDFEVYSHELRARKPDVAAYDALVTFLGCDDPASILFIDDKVRPRNRLRLCAC